MLMLDDDDAVVIILYLIVLSVWKASLSSFFFHVLVNVDHNGAIY
jgi:hypothetical protein